MIKDSVNTIRSKREALGWSMKDLAEKAGVNVVSICHWENGKKEPRPSKKRQLAEALSCSVQELFPMSPVRPKLTETDATFSMWFVQAWERRFVFELYGWFDLSRLRQGVRNNLSLKDCLVVDRALEIIIIPTNEVSDAPALFRQMDRDEWVETPQFFDFEQQMSVMLSRKHILRNDIAYYPHKQGLALQPAVGKEARFPEITSKLMDGLPHYRKETIDLVFR